MWDLLSRETVQLKAKVVSVSSEFTSMIARPDAGNEAGPEVAAEDPNNGDQDAQNNAGNKAGPEVAAENNAGNNASNMAGNMAGNQDAENNVCDQDAGDQDDCQA